MDNSIGVAFGETLTLVLTILSIHMGYSFWKDFRPEADSKIKGIPAGYIWDIVFFIIVSLLLLDSGIITPIVCIILLWKAMERNRQNQTIDVRNQMINEKYEKISELNMEMQFLRHDWKNHLLMLNSMIQEGNYAEAQKYLGSLEESLNGEETHIITGDSMIDSILSQKTQNATEKNIDVEINCDYMEGLKVSEKDICILLANLYDNAIEAAEKVQKNPWIQVKLVRNGDMLMMKICNNYQQEPKKIRDRFISNKKDKELHGYGLLSVRHTLKKYDGDLDTKFEGDKFEACVTIYDGFE